MNHELSSKFTLRDHKTGCAPVQGSNANKTRYSWQQNGDTSIIPSADETRKTD
jgi:hypothetical protein